MRPGLGSFLRSPATVRRRAEALAVMHLTFLAHRACRRSGPDLAALIPEIRSIADELEALGPVLRGVIEAEAA